MITPSFVKITDDLEVTLKTWKEELLKNPKLAEFYKDGMYWIKNGKKEYLCK